MGELPPRGDYYPACMTDSNNVKPHMADLEQALMEKDGHGWKGPYLEKPIPRDPWGMEYTFMVMHVGRGPSTYDFLLWSAGPDRIYNTADDVSVPTLSKERN